MTTGPDRSVRRKGSGLFSRGVSDQAGLTNGAAGDRVSPAAAFDCRPTPRKGWLPSLLGYAWASPATLVGLFLAAIACTLGATARVRKGVIEVAGGRLASLAGAAPSALPILAITFGHVVLGSSHRILAAERAHEHVHVRQYQRWGVLFFPLYLGSSAWQFVRGRHPYWHNAFERQAFQVGSQVTRSQPGADCGGGL